VLLVLLRSGAESSQTARVLPGDGWWTDTETDTSRLHQLARSLFGVDQVGSRRTCLTWVPFVQLRTSPETKA